MAECVLSGGWNEGLRGEFSPGIAKTNRYGFVAEPCAKDRSVARSNYIPIITIIGNSILVRGAEITFARTM